MRYHVVSIQHNKDKDAENRSVPKAFDTELQARQAFHEQLGSDMSNTTLDWSVCMIFTDIGSVIASERWEAPEPEPTPETTATTTKEVTS